MPLSGICGALALLRALSCGEYGGSLGIVLVIRRLLCGSICGLLQYLIEGLGVLLGACGIRLPVASGAEAT